jgi:hypothetical protein
MQPFILSSAAGNICASHPLFVSHYFLPTCFECLRISVFILYLSFHFFLSLSLRIDSRLGRYTTMWLAPAKRFSVVCGANIGGDTAATACDELAAALIGMHL